MNPFGDLRPAGCRCPDLLDVMRATLEDREPPRCTVHRGTAEEEARATGLERIVAENKAAIAAIPEPEPPSSGDEMVDALERAVGLRPRLRLVTTSSTPLAGMLLNAAPDVIARALGMGTTDNQPPDAA